MKSNTHTVEGQGYKYPKNLVDTCGIVVLSKKILVAGVNSRWSYGGASCIIFARC